MTEQSGARLQGWPEPSRTVASGVVLLALVWLTVLWVWQAEAGGRLVVVPGVGLVPLLVSLLLPWWATGVVSAYAIGVVVALSLRTGGDLTSSDTLLRVGGAAATAGFAVLNAAVRRHREQRLARLAQVAEVAQGAILHAVPPELAGFRFASRYASASQDARVGGDLYDALETSRGVRLLVGDVRGKGLGAVRTAASVLSTFRQTAPRVELRLVDVAAALETALRAELSDEDFVSVVLCELGPLGVLEVVNCGHPPPLLVPVDGPARELVPTSPSPPLGLGVQPRAERHPFRSGDRLLLFTDGLSEARTGTGAFFDLVGHADHLRGHDLQRALDVLLAAAVRHAGGSLDDDVAVLLVAPPGSLTSPVVAPRAPSEPVRPTP